MLVAASVCPHPPLLVPAVSVAEPEWLARLREACVESLSALLATRPDRVAVIGAGHTTAVFDDAAGGTLRGFGVAVGGGGEDLVLPESLTIGAWLLDRVGWTGARRYHALAAGETAERCAAVGLAAVEGGERVAVLAMGDGSAKRTREAPGFIDERAGAFDAGVVAALSSVEPQALLAIDPELAADLWVAGRPAWQALAGAVATSAVPMAATTRYDAAPRGVGYFVVDWAVA